MSDDKKNVVDVEVISEEHDDSRKNGGTYTATYYYTNSGNGTGYERHYTYQDMFGLHAPGRDGLQYAGIVTLTLFFFCLFKFSNHAIINSIQSAGNRIFFLISLFLAALGFAFFEAVGSAFGLYYNLHTLLEGRVPNPWISRIIIWCVSLGLVAMLV